MREVPSVRIRDPDPWPTFAIRALQPTIVQERTFNNPFKTEAGKELIQVAAEKGAVEQVLCDAEERRLFKALQTLLD